MPYFLLRCTDSNKGAELRPLHRPEHLDYIRGSGLVRVAGPVSDEAGNTIGSLLIIEAADMTAARAFADGDPFRKLGVFETVDIHPYNISVLDFPAEA